MKLSTEIYTLSSRFGDVKALNLFAEAGFDSLDYSMYDDAVYGPAFSDNYKQYAAKLRQIARDCGIRFNQAHAPFGFCFDDYQNPLLIDRTKRAVEFAARLGAAQIVVHPVNCHEGTDQLAYNVDFYSQFDSLCDDFGIKIAIENMWGYDRDRCCFFQNVCSNGAELAKYVDIMGKNFCACLDVGHCVLVREKPEEAVRQLGRERLRALHIHDNNFRDDDHLLPYSGKIDWDVFMRTLGKIGYEGDLTLEALSYFKKIPDDYIFEAVKYAERMGRYLISKASHNAEN